MEKLGHYEILEEIGRGGFATVFRARDTRMEREVALKVIAGNYAHEPAFMERFRQEALTAARLRHPRIVPIYDFGDVDGELYLAMAFIEGRTLRALLEARERLSLREALPILGQVAEALDYLHRQGLVHQDVRPSNVMLEREDRDMCVTLTDFGLVRSMETSATLAQMLSILGTPAYVAPEQADPERWGEVTPLTDVYALGVIAYEMLVGRQPFVGEPAAVIDAQASEPATPPLELAPDLGDDLAQVLLQGLVKPSEERYQSAGALVAALRQVAEAGIPQEQQEAELTQLIAGAQTAREAGDWLAVQNFCVRAMQIDRAHPEALTMMSEATQELQRESAEEAARRRRAWRYEQGSEALEAGEWEAAVAAFEEVFEGNPDFREVQEKLAQARDELQRAQWRDMAISYGEERRWAEACRLWLKLLRGRLEYRDGDAWERLLDAVDGLLGRWDALLKAFKQQQSDLELHRGTLRLFDALVGAFEAKDWERVVEVGEQLSELAPELKRPQAWLARAREERKRPAIRVRDQNIVTWEQDSKELVRVPTGTFLYGDDRIRVDLPEFWIDKTPVTNAEFARFAQASGYITSAEQKGTGWVWNGNRWEETEGADWRHPGGPQTSIDALMDHPVVQVSWDDAAAYAAWAGKRLPTEEEWEKAARGTEGQIFPWGDSAPAPELCNFGKNEGGTTPVGKYSPKGDSPYGCVDMAGNVWEWTASDHERDGKVLRGGSWFNDDPVVLRCASRDWLYPYSRNYIGGFRCAKDSE